MSNTIYTLGYSGWSPAAVASKVEALDAILLDIRYSPWSKRAEWRGESLKSRLGRDRYSHLKTLGNRNYRGGPILLDAPEAAVPAVARALSQHPIILLCGCRDAATCHRSVAADYLSGQMDDAPIVHLYPDEGQLDLTETERQAAAHAWQNGSASLGLWLSGHKERATSRRGFSVAEYGTLVRVVREYAGDTRDYSQETA